jgi:hypothetical protein
LNNDCCWLSFPPTTNDPELTMMIGKQLSRVLVLAALVCAVPDVLHAQNAKARALDAALVAYQLTMPKVDAWVLAGVEMAHAFKGRTPPDMDGNEAKTIDEMAAQYDAVPEMRRAIRKAKLSTREYATLSLVIMQAVMFESMLASTPNAKPPANMNPANLTFVRANKGVLQKKMEAAQAAAGQQGP